MKCTNNNSNLCCTEKQRVKCTKNKSIPRSKSTVWSAQTTTVIFTLLKSNARSAQTTKVFLVLKAMREVHKQQVYSSCTNRRIRFWWIGKIESRNCKGDVGIHAVIYGASFPSHVDSEWLKFDRKKLLAVDCGKPGLFAEKKLWCSSVQSKFGW